MNALIVIESEFGNTQAVAEAVSDGIRTTGRNVTLIEAEDAPAEVPADIDLLLVGAPTHNLHAPTPASRRKAATAEGFLGRDTGVMEWIERAAHRPEITTFTFDTSISKVFSGSASTAIARALRRHGYDPVARRSFIVAGTTGPLRKGELELARLWGIYIASEH
jgi:hypothetical protein